MDEKDDLSPLLARVARSDRAAFRQLYDLAAPKLFGIALRISRDRSIAEDVLQDAFTDIWRKAATFDESRGSAKAWLSIVVRNRTIDALRRRSSGVEGETQVSDDAFQALADPASLSAASVDYMALVACLEELEARDREMVLRAYYRGETREELASRFEAPVNTIKTWLRRGLGSLKECLER